MLPIEHFSVYQTSILAFLIKNDLIKHNLLVQVNSDTHDHDTRRHLWLHPNYASTQFGQYVVTNDGFRTFNDLIL